MKRLICFLLCLLFRIPALSEGAPVNPFACDCEFDAEKGEVCSCFLQEGDIGPFVNGVIVLLKERGYLAQQHAGGVFDAEVTEAVKRFQYDVDLTETGVMDHETLSYLLLYGVFDETLLLSDEDVLLWVPTDGGDKLHKDKQCSEMIAPRKISERNALLMSIKKCEHCFGEDCK